MRLLCNNSLLLAETNQGVIDAIQGDADSSLMTQLQQLQQHLLAFAEIKDKATEAMPFIQDNLNNITRSIGESVNFATDKHGEMLENTLSTTEQFKSVSTNN